MAPAKSLFMYTYLLQYLSLSSALSPPPSHHDPKCKPIPSDPSWPSLSSWNSLNSSVSGRLLAPPPPGAVCHPTQPTFDALKCPVVMAEWRLNAFHAANPISNTINNWNNDSCLPIPAFPCSGAGYPVYVINATSEKDVKKGVDFARKTGVRLVVKGTGHDYLGRSQAPNALSIWTRHISGLKHYPAGTFTPKSCRKSSTSTTAAITVGAGVPMVELNAFSKALNLTNLSGGAATVGLGGYLSGAGHSALSPVFGLAADNVLEITVVTPKGDILVTNECQNTDLFWALRGGGGGTFGVATSFTIRAFPTFRYATVQALIGVPTASAEAFFNGITKWFSLLPSLADQGISMYSDTAIDYNATDLGIPFTVNGIRASFALPLIPGKTSTTQSTLTTAIEALVNATKTAGGADQGEFWISTVLPQEYDDFYTYWIDHNGPEDGGQNMLLASRLLTKDTLTKDPARLKTALKALLANSSITAHLISGPGVHDTSKIPGGSNAVLPAWRDAYLHTMVGVLFPPLDPAERRRKWDYLTNVASKPLRDLQPNGGSYINEANVEEPDYEKAFWGKNYDRLVKIKKQVDPEGVFWCSACVSGREWREKVGSDGKTRVCKV